MLLNDADGIANNVDPDQSDLGLHCLPRPVCPKTQDHFSRIFSGAVVTLNALNETDISLIWVHLPCFI